MGIRRGNTRAELESFPGVQVLLRSEPEEQSAAATLLASLWNFSPRAQVLAVRSGAHRLVLDITGTERIFGKPTQLAHAVLREMRSLGLMVQLAVSHNFHTAVCVAPYAGPMPHIIMQSREREALAPLPIAALETLTEEQRDTFASWGLHTLGEAAVLPETQLIARIGQAGKQIRLLARGEHPHLLEPEEERFTLQERTEFDSPVEMLESLLFVLGPMLDQLVLLAMRRALALASVTVRLQLTNQAAEETSTASDAAIYVRTVKPALPLAESRVLLKLLQLELQAHPPGAPVVSVELNAETGDRARAQLGLFSPQLPEPSRLDVTLARIRALVGEGRVGRPKLLDSHQPESFVMEQFVVTHSRDMRANAESISATQSDFPRNVTKQGGQTLRRLRPPALLRMRATCTHPKLFFWQGAHYEITASYGPWQHSGNWWSADAWSHEEWDVTAAAADGTTLQCRLTYDLLHRHWRLEGLYD